MSSQEEIIYQMVNGILYELEDDNDDHYQVINWVRYELEDDDDDHYQVINGVRYELEDDDDDHYQVINGIRYELEDDDDDHYQVINGVRYELDQENLVSERNEYLLTSNEINFDDVNKLAGTFRGTNTLDKVRYELDHIQIKKDGDQWHVDDDVLIDIERIEINNGNIALDIEGNDSAGAIYRLYQSAFARVPDSEGLGYWINNLDKGMSLEEIASYFVGSNEFADKYGYEVSDEDYVNALYENTLLRAPDQQGYDYWIGQFETNSDMTREKMLVNFSESYENQLNVNPIIENGFWYLDPYIMG